MAGGPCPEFAVYLTVAVRTTEVESGQDESNGEN
jgi:hypothetical protein